MGVFRMRLAALAAATCSQSECMIHAEHHLSLLQAEMSLHGSHERNDRIHAGSRNRLQKKNAVAVNGVSDGTPTKDGNQTNLMLYRANSIAGQTEKSEYEQFDETLKKKDGFPMPEDLMAEQVEQAPWGSLGKVPPIIPSPDAAKNARSYHFSLPSFAQEKVARIATLLDRISRKNSVHGASLDFLLQNEGGAQTAQQAAKAMLATIAENGTSTAGEIIDLITLFSQTQSAESAAANGVLITATHLAMLVGGFRGEDYAANYNNEKNKSLSHKTYQGDMFMEGESRPWRNSQVKYCLAPDLSPRIKDLFKAAVAHYTRAVPCLQFEDVGVMHGDSNSIRANQRCMVSPAIFVASSSNYGCFSHRGMMDGKSGQLLQLNDPGCALIGTVLHELGHALGLGHERPAPTTSILHSAVAKGRGKYLSSMFTNRPGDLDSHNSLSVMHLDPYAFRQNPKHPTLDGPDISMMGQRVGLAASDVDRLVHMYSLEFCNTSSTFNGLGCVDDPVAEGAECPSIKSSTPWCSKYAYQHCCACGSGTYVQCYKGSQCPKVQAKYILNNLRVLMIACFLGVVVPIMLYFGSSVFGLRKRAASNSPKKHIHDLTEDDGHVEEADTTDLHKMYHALDPSFQPQPEPVPEPLPRK